jgi:hypothetical protein
MSGPLGHRARLAVVQRVAGGHAVGAAVLRGEPAVAVEAPAGGDSGDCVAVAGVGGQQ